MSRRRNYSRGFTLLESVVIISIITILTLIITPALPLARQEQHLVSDTTTIQRIVRDAQGRALNEVRPPECIAAAKDPVTCSDVGVMFSGQSVKLFADLNSDQKYSNEDFDFETVKLESNVKTDTSLVYNAIPPTIILYHDGTIISANSSIPLTLVDGSQTKELKILPYGQIEINK